MWQWVKKAESLFVNLQELANAKGNILENKELLDSLNKTKASSITIADSLAESVRLQAPLDQVNHLAIQLVVDQQMFCVILENSTLPSIVPFYHTMPSFPLCF